jgi:drug/metabolite transporter (DMT)-like permease
MPVTASSRDWGLLIALTVMWGSAFALTKVAVGVLSPSVIVAARLAIAAPLLLGLFLLQRRPLPRSPRLWIYFVLIAILGNVLPFWLISWGQRGIDSGLAGILMSIMPLVVIVLSHFTIPGERMNRYRIVGFLLGFSGVVVLTGPSAVLGIRGEASEILAMLAVLGGAVCYGVSAILSRLRPGSSALEAAAATILLAALLALPPVVPLLDALPGADSAHAAWLAVLGLGVFSTALPAIVYFRLIETAGPHFVSFLNYLIPLWAVALGAVLLDERPGLGDLAALAIILTGIAVASRERRRGS